MDTSIGGERARPRCLECIPWDPPESVAVRSERLAQAAPNHRRRIAPRRDLPSPDFVGDPNSDGIPKGLHHEAREQHDTDLKQEVQRQGDVPGLELAPEVVDGLGRRVIDRGDESAGLVVGKASAHEGESLVGADDHRSDPRREPVVRRDRHDRNVGLVAVDLPAQPADLPRDLSLWEILIPTPHLTDAAVVPAVAASF